MKIAMVLGALALLLAAVGAGELKLSWRAGKRMPVAAAVAGAMTTRGLVVAGGTSWQNDDKLWLKEARLYDVSRDAWSDLPSLPESLGNAAVAAVRDAVYVIGGSDGQSTSNRVYRLRSGASAWEAGPALPEPRVYAGADALGSRIFLAGGSSDVKPTPGSTELWALETAHPGAAWQKLARLPGRQRTLAGVVAAAGKLYLFGGYTDVEAGKPANLADAWVYDPAADRWQQLPDLPVANRYMGVAAWDEDTILLIGGALTRSGAADEITDRTWAYHIKAKRFSELARTPGVNAGMAFGRAGINVVGAGGEPAGKTRSDAVWIATP